MSRRSLALLIAVLVVAAALSPVHAERELEFAKGLQQLKLFDLCFAQYKKVLAMKDLDPKERIEAELAFAKAYMDAAEDADKPYIKDEYFDLAAKQFDEFLKNHPKDPKVYDVRFQKATLQQTRASERSRSLENIRDKKKAAEVVKGAEKLFQDAITQFGEVGQTCQTDMEKISGITRDPRLKAKRADMMKRFLLATNQAAWTRYYWSEMYGRPIVADKKKEKEQIDKAIAEFKKYVDDYGNFVIALSGRIGLGACYEKIGDINIKSAALKEYEKASDEYRRVTQKRPSGEANPFRFHAYSLLGRVYKKMGELEPGKNWLNDSIKQVNILIEQLPEDHIFQEPTDQAMAQEQITLKKAMLEKAEAFFLLAKTISKPGEKDKAVAKGAKAVNDVIKAGGPMARVAMELRNKWSKVYSKLKGQKTANELIGIAKQRFDEAEKMYANPATRKKAGSAYSRAIRAYELVIMAADPDDDIPFIGESWQHIGLSYFKQGCYFEAALAFGMVPQILPDHPKAPDIAFASTQLFGHVLDHDHVDQLLMRDGSIVRGEIAKKDANTVVIDVPDTKGPKRQTVSMAEVDKIREDVALDHMMDIYVAALERFARGYPDDKRATEAVFRSADALRSGGRFGQAAKLYETIPSHAAQYEKACYLSGQGYWAAYLAAISADATKAKEAAGLWQKAAQKLTGYLNWAAEQPIISPEHTRLKRYWMAKSRLRLANIYSYDTVKEYEKALQILNNFENDFFKELFEQAKVFHKEAVDLAAQQKKLQAMIAAAKKAKKDTSDLDSKLQLVEIELEQRIGTLNEINNIEVEVNTYRINSYAGLGQLDQAKTCYQKLNKDPKVTNEQKGKLSRILAMAYLKHVDNLKEKKVAGAELQKAQDEAATFVLNVPKLNPNLSPTDLIWYGARLFELGHQADASKVFQAALAKLEQAGQKYSPQYWGVVRRIASAYEEAEIWKDAVQWEKALLAWEKVYTLCLRNQEMAKTCYEDKTKAGDLLGAWQDRDLRGAWVVCLLLSDGKYASAAAAYKDEGKRATAVEEWRKMKEEQRKQAFAKFGAKPLDPFRLGISPEMRRRLAYAIEMSGQHKEALVLWEAISTDIQRGTPVWLDAKYHEVVCLLAMKEQDEAKRVMSSVLIPYPKLGTPEMEKKYLALIQEKFTKKNREELTKTREEAMDESKLKKKLDAEDKKALERYERKPKDKK